MSQKGYYPPVIEKPGQAHYSTHPHMPQAQPYQSHNQGSPYQPYQGHQPYTPHPQPQIVYVQQAQPNNSSVGGAFLPCACLAGICTAICCCPCCCCI